tara:strand:+ start:16350 stop:17837 length:1488 start_codon:yes stop_codon:yes gene_type:complete
MSIFLDVNPLDPAPFVDRPWPHRTPGNSPLSGRRVLVVDGDLAFARQLAEDLARMGCATRAVQSSQALEEALATDRWEALVLDPRQVDDEIMVRVSCAPNSPLLLIADYGLTNGSSGSMLDQAWATLPAPLTAEAVRVALGRALEARALAEENARLRDELTHRSRLGSFVTRDRDVNRLLETARTVADTRATVLILGESGTGKSLLARGMHSESDRSSSPFIAVNCGALPGGLLESELFGHVQGAFTGATRDKVGRFEAAEGGTLFLDEIDSAPPELQVKLLRVLQEREYERVGDDRTRTTDVRIIAASNADLPSAIEAGEFREDLFWRLNVVSLDLPPLRERPGDIALLAESFVRRFAEEHASSVRGLDPTTLAVLSACEWPGNVRQLENALERAVLLCRGPWIEVRDLPDGLRPTNTEPATDSLVAGLAHLEHLPTLKVALEGPERAILVRALELCDGHRLEAAAMLGINRSTLFNKMRKYDLQGLSFDEAGA